MKFTFATLLFAMIAGCGDRNVAQINIGDAAPQFETVRLAGAPARYPEAWTGKPLAINFWSETCGECELEMKIIERVYQRQRSKGLEVLAINVDQGSTSVAALAKTLGVSFPILLDDKVAIARKYGVVALPTTFFVDSTGVVRAKLVGPIEEVEFEKLALEALK